MTEGCAHCARREAELAEVAKERDYFRKNQRDFEEWLSVNAPSSTLLSFTGPRRWRKTVELLNHHKAVATSKLAAILRQVAALEAEWRAEKAENEQEAENLGAVAGGFALERASKIEDFLDALDTLKEML